MSSKSSLTSTDKSKNLFFAIKKCLEYILLEWNQVDEGRIEVYLLEKDFLQVSISSSLIKKFPISFNPKSFQEEFCVEFSVDALQSSENNCENLGFHFHLITHQELENPSHAIEKIGSYLSFFYFKFQSKCEVTFFIEGESGISEYSFEGLRDEMFLKVNTHVCNYFLNDKNAKEFSLPIKVPTNFNLKETIKNTACEEIEVCIDLISTVANNFQPMLFFYIFDPYGYPVFSSQTSLSLIDTLVPWNDYGLFLKNVPFKNKNELLEPYYVKELKFTKNVEPCNIIVMVNIGAVAGESVTNKLEISQYFQGNIEDILLHNHKPMSKACKDVIDQALLEGKSAKQRRICEMTAVNAATSIFEIVAHSTNTVFRETCMSLMGSATTHGFKSDIYDAIKKCSEDKIEAKRRKRSRKQDDYEWDLLQNTSAGF